MGGCPLRLRLHVHGLDLGGSRVQVATGKPERKARPFGARPGRVNRVSRVPGLDAEAPRSGAQPQARSVLFCESTAPGKKRANNIFSRSSREVRIRVPIFFSVVYFRGTLPQSTGGPSFVPVKSVPSKKPRGDDNKTDLFQKMEERKTRA